ncbi:ABHD17A [Symbiodinium necroappetens]|uniref:ABHD17A protein n=1 Tax=Symbiodinium necroappetens TaxID=1628268 RepID=A0A813B501_9DINO|nr:ABHD17A [Symbiodinium necroappetens]
MFFASWSTGYEDVQKQDKDLMPLDRIGSPLFMSVAVPEDLGQRLHYLDMMSQLCASDVLAYDYCGYGFSEGEPSEENCIQCIDAAYAYLLQHFAPNRIVLFGRSIGTGPTVDLAVRHPEIRGVILQSPIESCGRAVFGNLASWLGYRMDLFRNYEKVDKVECPVLVMHGTDDDIVPIESGMAIQEARLRVTG